MELSKIEQKILDTLAEGGTWERRSLPGDGYEHLEGPNGLVSRGLVEFVGYNGSCLYYRLPPNKHLQPTAQPRLISE